MTVMEKNIVVFEDDPAARALVETKCRRLGWEVIASASTMEEAKQLIHKLPTLPVLYALVDGNLSSHAINGEEGEEIVQAIHAVAPEVKTISFSVDRNKPPSADFHMGKSGLSHELERILTS